VSPVDVDDVEAGGLGAERRRDVETLSPADLPGRQLARVRERKAVRWELAGSTRRDAARRDIDVSARMPQLDPDERSLLVRLLADSREVPHVVVIPEPRRGRHRVPVRLRVDRGELDAHRAPAALRSGRPKPRLRARRMAAEASRMRHLEEAIRNDLRADPHRLEQDLVAGIARHLDETLRDLSTAVRRRSGRRQFAQQGEGGSAGPRAHTQSRRWSAGRQGEVTRTERRRHDRQYLCCTASTIE
jgi:hypothetical protein